jgi:hypothetical protein
VLGGGFQILSALLMDRLVYFSLQLLSFYFLFLDDRFLHAVRSRLLSFGPGRAK